MVSGIFLIEIRELLRAVRAPRHLFHLRRNVSTDFESHVVESVRCKLRAKRRRKLWNLSDAVILSKSHEVRFGQRRAQNIRAGPREFAVLHANRSAILLQHLDKSRALSPRAKNEQQASGESERPRTIHFHSFSISREISKASLLNVF